VKIPGWRRRLYGLIQQLGMRPGFRKPHILYSLTGEAEYLFPTAYGPLLRHVLAVIGRRLPSQELRTSLREVGRTAAMEHLDQIKGKTPNQRIEIALSALNALGGEATVQEKRGDDSFMGMVVRFLQPLPIIRKLA
jgi:predicted ArsR family transcriptional regulator